MSLVVRQELFDFDDLYEIVCSQSQDVMDAFRELDKEEEFFEFLETCYPNGDLLDHIDDVIRFQTEDICDYCGVSEDEFCKAYTNKDK